MKHETTRASKGFSFRSFYSALLSGHTQSSVVSVCFVLVFGEIWRRTNERTERTTTTTTHGSTRRRNIDCFFRCARVFFASFCVRRKKRNHLIARDPPSVVVVVVVEIKWIDARFIYYFCCKKVRINVCFTARLRSNESASSSSSSSSFCQKTLFMKRCARVPRPRLSRRR